MNELLAKYKALDCIEMRWRSGQYVPSWSGELWDQILNDIKISGKLYAHFNLSESPVKSMSKLAEIIETFIACNSIECILCPRC